VSSYSLAASACVAWCGAVARSVTPETATTGRCRRYTVGVTISEPSTRFATIGDHSATIALGACHERPVNRSINAVAAAATASACVA
jgi:hypothetical protein